VANPKNPISPLIPFSPTSLTGSASPRLPEGHPTNPIRPKNLINNACHGFQPSGGSDRRPSPASFMIMGRSLRMQQQQTSHDHNAVALAGGAGCQEGVEKANGTPVDHL